MLCGQAGKRVVAVEANRQFGLERSHGNGPNVSAVEHPSHPQCRGAGGKHAERTAHITTESEIGSCETYNQEDSNVEDKTGETPVA